MVIVRSRFPALITTKAVITLVMLAIGRSVFRPRLHSSLPVAAFSTAADRAATPDGPAEEAAARAGAAPSKKVTARAAAASNPHTRTVSRPLVLMTTPRSMAAGQQGQACQ